jgi:hypothetical protein
MYGTITMWKSQLMPMRRFITIFWGMMHMKAVKSSHNEDISKMKLSSLGKIIDQVTDDDVRSVKTDVISIFRGMKR